MEVNRDVKSKRDFGSYYGFGFNLNNNILAKPYIRAHML